MRAGLELGFGQLCGALSPQPAARAEGGRGLGPWGSSLAVLVHEGPNSPACRLSDGARLMGLRGLEGARRR